ncbi:hypothetical protein [Arenicella xantha]|uniref:Uncharacterized protein n=1 Tax=Arenicella xantha TaxID=644221 RepID=A0A395JT92_9GAMM|nr:hypothetical protein [Arenicella xantha]RBP53765.1 hypothetical protein DFR28_1011154 [Arenicella xantha]
MLGIGAPKLRLMSAAFVAVVLHGLILSQTIITPTQSNLASSPPLSVQLLTQKPELQELKQDVLPPEPESLTEPVKQEDPSAVTPTTVLVANAKDDPQPIPTVRLPTTVVSSEFRSFLQEETKQHANSNQQEVNAFSQTFETVYVPDESPTEITRDMLPTDSGVFMTVVNGKRVCGTKIIQLLSSDGLGVDTEGSYLIKDCAPKETFVLDMNKPNNG